MSSESSLLLAAFRERLLRDRLNGEQRPLQYYQSLFPGYEAVIASDFARFGDGETKVTRDRAAERRLGPFTVERELGRGGQGVVFLATDTRLNRRVALKVMARRPLDGGEQLKRFEREAALAARLHHPAIATVYETGSFDGEVFVAMQYVQGESLRTAIERQRRSGTVLGRAEILERVRAYAKVVAAVGLAHETGIVHRDLKPSNLLCAPDGTLTVLDFGLARDYGEDSDITQTGDVFGSPAYMSPEQIDGLLQVDARSDVFSLASTLYEWLTGEHAFLGATRDALFHAIRSEEPKPPRLQCPAIPRELSVVLSTAFSKDRRHRYQTAQDFAADLQAVADGRPVAVVPLRPWQRLARWVHRNPKQATLVLGWIVALLAISGCGGYVLARRPVWLEGRRAIDAQQISERIATAFGGSDNPDQFHSPATLERTLAERPELVLVRLYLALHALARGESEVALRLIEVAPSDADEARAFLRIQDAASGSELPPPRTPVGHLEQFTAGVLAFAQADRLESAAKDHRQATAQALQYFENAIFASPKAELLYYVSYARAMTSLVKYDAAVAVPAGARVASALARLWPKSAVALHWAANVAGYEDRTLSIEWHRACLGIDPDHVGSMTGLAYHALLDKNLPEALDWFERATQAMIRQDRPDPWRDHCIFGAMLVKHQHFTEAERPLRRALEFDPPDPEPYLLLARLERNRARNSEARALLERAEANAAGSDDTALLLLEILREQEDSGALSEALERWTTAHPTDANAWLERGNLLVDQDQWEEAWIVLDQALTQLPADTDESLRAALVELQSRIDEHE